MSREQRTFKKVIRARKRRALAKKSHDPQFRAFTAMAAQWKLFPASMPKQVEMPTDEKQSHVVQDTSKH